MKLLLEALTQLHYHGVRYLVVNRRFYCEVTRYVQERADLFDGYGERFVPEWATDEYIVDHRLGDSITFRGRRLMMLEEDMALPLAQEGEHE